MTAPQSNFIHLKDGRKLSFAEFEDPKGKPVLYFHGSPGSRLEGALFDEEFSTAGLRLIAPDRPGMGQSDFKPGWTWLGLTTDLADLANILGLDEFIAMGYSGGGTLALACAFALPDRVSAAWLIGSWAPVSADNSLFELIAPLDRFFFQVGKNAPCLFNLPFYMLLLSSRYLSRQAFIRLLESSMSAADWQVAQLEEFGPLLQQDVREAFSQGVRGPGHDALMQYLDWGFDIGQISAPVQVLHGTVDQFAPYPFAEYLHKHLPESHLYTVEGDGHFAIHQRIKLLLEQGRA